MNIQTTKLELIELLLHTENVNNLAKIKEIFSSEPKVKISKSNSVPISLSQAEKKALDKGLQSIAEGKTYSHSVVKEKLRKRHPQLLAGA